MLVIIYHVEVYFYFIMTSIINHYQVEYLQTPIHVPKKLFRKQTWSYNNIQKTYYQIPGLNGVTCIQLDKVWKHSKIAILVNGSFSYKAVSHT